MTFSREIRGELLLTHPKKRCCREALMRGILFGTPGRGPASLPQETGIALARLAEKLYPKGIPSESLVCNEIPADSFLCDGCVWNFVKGAFLACGTVSKPENSYHLEFLITGRPRAEMLCAFLAGKGLQPGITGRHGGRYGVYFKNSEEIFDLFGYMGAGKAAFRLLDAKIYRDLRNEANRVSNCELANIRRTIDASAEQMRAIQTIVERGAEKKLPEELRQTFDLRAAFPDDSLAELAEKHVPQITKSGVNHRLRRIIEFAEGL